MNTYKLTQDERFALVMECRQNGMTDHQWYEEHGIATNAIYRWIRKFRQEGYPNVPGSCKSSSAVTATPQQAVKINVVPDTSASNSFFDSVNNWKEAAVEIIRGNTLVRINNNVEMAEKYNLSRYKYIEYLLERRPNADMTDA